MGVACAGSAGGDAKAPDRAVRTVLAEEASVTAAAVDVVGSGIPLVCGALTDAGRVFIDGPGGDMEILAVREGGRLACREAGAVTARN